MFIRVSNPDPDAPENVMRDLADKQHLPMFFFSGILGDGNEVSLISQYIYKKSDWKRPIYLYHDDRLDNPEEENDAFPLDELVKGIAEKILKQFAYPPGAYPIYLVGYSYGGIIATLVGQCLKEFGYDVLVYIIDSASPQLCREHLERFPDTSILKSLIKIINYIAYTAGLRKFLNINIEEKEKSEGQENLIFLSKEDKDYIKKVTIKEAILKLEKIIISDNYNVKGFPSRECGNASAKFTQLMMIIKSNFDHLINYTPDKNLPLLDSITALMTEETVKKYTDDATQLHCGWKAHAKKVSLVKTKGGINLQKQDHTALVADPDIANAVANAIDYFLNTSIDDVQFEGMCRKYGEIKLSLLSNKPSLNNHSHKAAELEFDEIDSDDDKLKSGPINIIKSGYSSPVSMANTPGSSSDQEESEIKNNPLHDFTMFKTKSDQRKGYETVKYSL